MILNDFKMIFLKKLKKQIKMIKTVKGIFWSKNIFYPNEFK